MCAAASPNKPCPSNTPNNNDGGAEAEMAAADDKVAAAGATEDGNDEDEDAEDAGNNVKGCKQNRSWLLSRTEPVVVTAAE